MPSFSFPKPQLITNLLLIYDTYMSRSTSFVSLKLCGVFHFRFCIVFIKGGLSHLRQFLATESLSNTMKNAFCFTLKTLFALEMFKFLA